MDSFTPTKNNLFRAQRLLEFSNRGYHLLDRKRNVLMRSLLNQIEKAKELSILLDEEFNKAILSAGHAGASMGFYAAEELSAAVPYMDNAIIRYRSTMGVELPIIDTMAATGKGLFYSLYRSNVSMDIALSRSRKLRENLFRFVEIETSIFRLSQEIKKIQKRANSIEKIQIPKYEAIVKMIQESLDSKEREDLFRLKMMKNKESKNKKTL